MAWSSTIFFRNRRFFNFILAIAVIVLVILSNDQVRPMLGDLSFTAFYSPFVKLKTNIEALRNVVEENHQLKKQLMELGLQLSALQEAKRENSRLRDLIGFRPVGDYQVLPVKIISVFQHFYPIGAMINKGSDDGIRVNQAVVNRFGLAGKIKDVMSHSATVQLLTDPGNSVAVRVAETHQMGTVRYSPDKGMTLFNMPADAQIKKGDLIVTSGLGGVFPPGLAVAMIDTIFPNQGEVLKNVQLRPAVNFFEIDELYVVIGERR
jgi:rod shape-determining protein MreC